MSTELYRDSGGNWVSCLDGHSVTVTPPTPPSKPWFSHVDTRDRGTGGSVGFPQLDAILKANLTSPPAGPVGQFIHGYSGNDTPVSFAASSVASAQSLGIGAMLNIKNDGDWVGAAAGAYDSLWTGLMNSWPVEVYADITWEHEPENNTNYGGPGVNNTSSAWMTWAVTNGNAQKWKDGLKRFIDVCAPIIRSRGLNVKVGGCLMDYSWTVGTWQYFNWWDQITPANLGQVVFGIDHYQHFTSAGAAVSPNARRNALLSEVRSVGITSYSEFEHNIDRRQTVSSLSAPITGDEPKSTQWWKDDAASLMAIPEARMICEYHIPNGPASAQAWLMGSGSVNGGNNNTGGELKAFADICIAGKRGA